MCHPSLIFGSGISFCRCMPVGHLVQTPLDCLVLEDRGTFTANGESRTQWRRLWLAPKIGLVKEVMQVLDDDRVTFATEAHLMRHE